MTRATVLKSFLLHMALLVSAALYAGCYSEGVIVAQREPPKAETGEPCDVNSECEGGFCIGNVCSDGACSDDRDCPNGYICVNEQCEEQADFECTGDASPLIRVSPGNLEFGEVSPGNPQSHTVTIENLGECILTLSGVGLSDTSNDDYDCAPCDVQEYPRKLAPQRSLDITVTYDPSGPGAAEGQLLVRSDDTTAGADGIVAVDLFASYSGIPVLVVEPLELNFGYVSFQSGAGGSSRSSTLKIMNHGTGNAQLFVSGLFLDRAGASPFSVTKIEHNGAEVTAPSQADELLLPPYNPNDPNTWLNVEITYQPTDNRDATDELVVRAHHGDPAAANFVKTRVTGSSLGPAQIEVNPTTLEFRDPSGDPLRVGMVGFQQLTITNSGQSELNVDATLSDPSGDFTISPTFIPPIPAGGSFVASVFFNPTVPSDPSTPHNPSRSTDAFLNLTSNDPDTADALTTIALHGWAKGGTFDDVLKLEMNFENADNSWAGSDFRNVDLELISPTGFTCTKPARTINQAGDVVAETNHCEQWSDFMQEGSATWIGLGQYEEPERIILYGLGQDLANGQDFTVRVHYIEDCANIPTGILGSILGVGGSALLGVLGGAVGIPIAVDPGTISDLVTQNCWDHESSRVTTKIFFSGSEVAAPQVRLGSKGQSADVARIHRENGQFSILP